MRPYMLRMYLYTFIDVVEAVERASCQGLAWGAAAVVYIFNRLDMGRKGIMALS